MRGNQRGLTLIEIIVMVVIVAILCAIFIPGLSQEMRKRRAQTAYCPVPPTPGVVTVRPADVFSKDITASTVVIEGHEYLLFRYGTAGEVVGVCPKTGGR